MPQVCGVESLFPSDSLLPSDTLAPGSGQVFVPTLPLDPSDFPIDDSAAAFVATDEVMSLSRFYAARFFNDLPEWFQGLPLRQLPGVDPLPEYANDPDNVEAKHWGVQRIILRALAREQARIDYVLRGRVSLEEFAETRAFPHATPADDVNTFELTIREDEPAYIEAPASFVDPSTVRFDIENTELRTNRNPVYAEGSGAAGLRYIFAKRINDIQTFQLLGVDGGEFTLSLRGETTNPIAWDEPDPSVIQAEVEAFSFVEPGDIVITEVVSGVPGHWRAEWRESYAGTDIDEFTSDASALTGTDPIIDHVTEQEGNAGFVLVALDSATAPSDDYRLIGDASWDGTEFTAVDTYTDWVGGVANGRAYYNPFTDPQANNDVNPACTPLSQNEGLAPQLFAVTANWALDLWEQTFGLEVPSKNPVNTIQYPERRARLLRAVLGVSASEAAEYSYLAFERARELGIVIGEFEEAQYTDPGWDDEDFVINALDEVAFVQINNATAGTFAVSLDGVTWATIDWDTTDTAFETALINDLGLSVGDIEVVDAGSGRYYLHYGGQFTGVDMPALYVDTTNLVGLTPLVNGASGAAVNAQIVTAGAGPSTNEVQRFDLTNAVAGTLAYTWNGQTTDTVSYAADMSTVQTAFTDLANISADDISVSGLEGQRYDIEFVDDLAAQDVATITVDTTGLVGTPATVGQGLDRINLTPGDFWRGRNVDGPVYGYQLNGDPEESTYPWYLWTTVYHVEGLTEDPAGAATRIAALRDYINSMTPAHLQVGFDWGPLGGFIVGISLVGIDRV